MRDRWIGWDLRAQYDRLKLIANNSRFLILPEGRWPNVGSRVLGLLERRVAADWQHMFGHLLLLLETFVDPRQYRGSCYRGAGWKLLGRTSGEGLVRPGKHYQTHPKLLFAKPLQADFRARLCSTSLRGQPQP